MSMYELVVGRNQAATGLLLLLGFGEAKELGRLRDCYLYKGHITVLTRNGGGNREEHKEITAALQKHPLYASDNDEELDSTYASYHFKIPTVEQLSAEVVASMAEQGINPAEFLAGITMVALLATKGMTERFNEAMASLGGSVEE